MTSKKIFELPAMGQSPASNDLLHIVDVDDTTQSAEGTSKKITVQNFLGKVMDNTEEYDAGTTGSVKTIDWENSLRQRVVVNDDTDISFDNPPGGKILVLLLIQDDTGDRAINFVDDTFYWEGGVMPDFSTSADAEDLLFLIYDNENDRYYGWAKTGFNS